MQSLKVFNKFNLWGNSQPGQEGMHQMLEVIPGAALWIDLNNQCILGGNHYSLRMTAFTHNELKGLGLEKVLPDFTAPGNPIQKEQNLGKQRVIQRSGTPLYMDVHFSLFSPENQWAILKFVFPEQNLPMTGFDESENFQAILSCFDQNDLESAFEKLLEFAFTFLKEGSPYVLLANETKLNKKGLTAEELPPHLLMVDSGKLSKKTEIWDHARMDVIAENQLAIFTPIITPELRGGVLIIYPANSFDEQTGFLMADHFAKLCEKVILISKPSSPSEFDASKATDLLGNGIKDELIDGILVINEDLCLIDSNAPARKALGYDEDEILGRPLTHIMVLVNELAPALRSAFESTSLVDLGELTLLQRNGNSLLAHLRIKPIPEKNGIKHAAVFITDLSIKEEFRQRTLQLKQRALLGEVTAIFAHEVRNPVNNISTTLQLMRSRLDEDEKSREQIQTMMDDCERLTHLMTSTLAFSKTTELKLGAINLSELLQSILDRLEHRIASAHIKIKTKLSRQIPEINGDANGLEQVFTNIINNAIQAMKEKGGGVLSVSLIEESEIDKQHSVRVEISDTGPGISKEAQKQIFQPFYSSHENGTGLGLTITQRIVNAHSGQIGVQSFEGGTTFAVRLPRTQSTPRRGEP